MTDQIIDLDRSFASIPKDYEFEEDYWTIPGYGLISPSKWADLIKLRRVIILAEAGAGKTTEIRATTNRLRDDGKKAFFFRLEHLGGGFETAFETGNIKEFDEWQASAEQGWFFLDSVDEARLTGPKQFEAAIRQFASKLGDNDQRAHIYITSRFSEWKPKADFDFIKTHLPFYKPQKKDDENDDEANPINETETSSSLTLGPKKDNEIADPEAYKLCALDGEQIKKFSESYDVHDIGNFLNAIERAEAGNFAGRPVDLISLIDYWSKNQRLGNELELMESSVRFKLTESDSARDQVLPLSFAKAVSGAEFLAAAVTLTKKSRFLVPDSHPDLALQSVAIAPQNVLTDWNINEIRALLQRPIFDEAIYGTVRFHHRGVREFLTAKWLHRLLENGKSRRAIEALFFAERYGEKVTLPSMRPILSWLILFDDQIRDKTLEIAPDLFIDGGAPSALPTDLRKDILEKICADHASQNVKRLSFDISQLGRFAHPDLSETVNCLLDSHSDNEEILQQLLRMIWQGEMKNCSGKLLDIAMNQGLEFYTRRNAIRAIGACGSAEQNSELKYEVVSNTDWSDKGLIAQCIESVSPEMLSVQDVLTLVERLTKSNRRKDYSLEDSLKGYCARLSSEQDAIDWIEGLLQLLKKPPYVERRHFEVSAKNLWLLTYAERSVKRLIRRRSIHAFNEAALEVVQLATIHRDYNDYSEKNKELNKLISDWPEFYRAVFWFNVKSSRQIMMEENGQSLTEWRFIDPFLWIDGSVDSLFELFLKDIADKSLLDDRLVALSFAFSLYVHLKRGRKRREQMKKTVSGVLELEDKLHEYLNPPPMSDGAKQHRKTMKNWKRRDKRTQEKKQKNLIKYRDWLEKNISILKDTSAAKEGKITNALHYLIHQVEAEDDGGSSRYAEWNWKSLIPIFGQEIAEAFRNSCVDYWRKYMPLLRSDGIKKPNETPYAVIVGLSGLEIESRETSNWIESLSEQEVDLACRYAFREINGFPSWFEKLRSAYPGIVDDLIFKEIEWEIAKYKGEADCDHILSDIAWNLNKLKVDISSRVFEALKRNDPNKERTLRNALEITLDEPNLDKVEFAKLGKKMVEESYSQSKIALWLAAWMGVDAKGAIAALQMSLNRISVPEDATKFAMEFLNAFLGDRFDGAIRSRHEDFLNVNDLLTLYKLIIQYVRYEDDIDRTEDGVFSPGPRDHAQDSRSRLLELIKKIPGKPTYQALMCLSKDHPNVNLRRWCASDAKGRAELDAEFEPWQSEAVADFSKETEKLPQNHRELFDLSVSRLLDLKVDLEHGDNSPAEVYRKVSEETQHRNFIAGWLRDKSKGRYSVPQEDELADGKRPDIRIQGAGLDAPVPIELKIVDNGWTFEQLIERLQNQLCGDYLRDSRSNCGVFLLVHLGQKKFWIHPETRERLGFEQLVQILEESADEVVKAPTKVEAIEVIGIDLTKRATRNHNI